MKKKKMPKNHTQLDPSLQQGCLSTGQPGSAVKLVAEGMDLSLPGALERWRQILWWVYARSDPTRLEYNEQMASATRAPRTAEEKLEALFLRDLIMAETPEQIERACCPKFQLKSFTADEAIQTGNFVMKEAFRCLTAAFQLTVDEIRQARAYADHLAYADVELRSLVDHAERPSYSRELGPGVFLCAQKFNIVRRAVVAEQRRAVLSDREAVADAAARKARRSQDPADVPPSHPSFPLTVGQLIILDANWEYIKMGGQIFDLKGRKQIKRALRFLWDNGFTSTTGKRTTVKAVCEAAGQRAKESNLHSIFHVMGKPATPAVDYDHLYDLLIDSTRGLGVLLKI